MNNRTIQRVIILGALAILLVIATQTYWVMRTWDMTARDFDQTVNIALQNVALDFQKVTRTRLPPQDLIQRLSSNAYAVNLNTQINAQNLDFFLRKNFEANALNEDFQYAIYDCHDEKLVYGKYVSYSPSRDTSDISRDLPTLANATYYFVVKFPKRTASLLGSMTLIIVFTVISLITVLFFIYSLIIILRQKRLSELQKDFINNMTHEFKTPISTIKVAADTFANAPSVVADARLSKYAQIIREQNNRLNTQVEKVLQITRIEKNTLQINPEIINLHELLETIVPSQQVKTEDIGGILTQRLDATQAYISADMLHLSNIIHNLLDNALKYCKNEKPEITVATENIANNYLRLVVSDKGIGIASEHQKKIFMRFYRVPTGDLHNVKGFGLGLYYVKNIVQAHNWRLDLTSKLGEGTTITIEIPKVLGNKS